MAQNEKTPKGNSSDTLLSIYVLRILKKYSSPKNKLSVGDVLEYLKKEGFIGEFESEEAWRKKVRRYLDTLYESYWNGCIKKDEGKTRSGHKWFYDALKDEADAPMVQIPETLSDVELDFIIDLIAATKILNVESTLGIIHKLLKKTSLSKEEQEQRLREIKKESWLKNPNDYLLETKEIIQEYMDQGQRIHFDYEGGSFSSVTPCGWGDADGKYILKAKIGTKKYQFFLDKIRGVDEDGYDDEDAEYYDEGNSGNNTSLESLFSNLPFIKGAIKEKKEIQFTYRSFVVKNGTVLLEDNVKTVLPHSLVFNDGKYYLIGIDQDATDTDRLGYFRVDLIADLEFSKSRIRLSDWNAQVYEKIQRARLIERHPLMLAGKEQKMEFLVRESALDRVRDAYGISPNFSVTQKNLKQKDEKNPLETDQPRENLIRFTVETTYEEAFRWALANADAVELVHPQELRDRLGRIATPIHQLYTKTLSDKVREKIDYIRETGMFKISLYDDEDTAFETFKELKKQGNLEIVDKIHIAKINGESGEYFDHFVNARDLCIVFAPNCKNVMWASKLTKIGSLSIHETQIKDASWLKVMKSLRWVEITKTPIRDLSVLKDHKHILSLDVSDTLITDISFIESYEHLGKLDISGCPIEDYTPLLKIKPLDRLIVDEKAVAAIGMDELVKHHPDAVIKVQQKIDNRKV